jgi:hypothetical protein
LLVFSKIEAIVLILLDISLAKNLILRKLLSFDMGAIILYCCCIVVDLFMTIDCAE